jgi:predicted DNA-binding transcriptional regulator YafY
VGDFLYYERFSWLDRELRSGRFPNAAGLAERFELSRKQAQRTIDHLRDRFGAPLDYDARHRGYRYRDDSFELPRLPATQEELLAVLLAHRLLRHADGGHISAQIRHFGHKLLAQLDQHLSFDLLERSFSADWHGHSPIDARLFRLVSDTLLKHRLLRFAYRSPRNGETTRRTVEPHHLQHYQASWVLIAHCRLRGHFRKFFLARMRQARMLPDTFVPRPLEDWQHLCRGAFGIFQGRRHVRVTLKFTPHRAGWVREQHWHPRQQIQEQLDGGLTLSFPVADFREVKLEILRFGADCEVLAPEALRRAVSEEIGRMAGVYAGIQPSAPADGADAG